MKELDVNLGGFTGVAKAGKLAIIIHLPAARSAVNIVEFL
jgi:hypothetical protein